MGAPGIEREGVWRIDCSESLKYESESGSVARRCGAGLVKDYSRPAVELGRGALGGLRPKSTSGSPLFPALPRRGPKKNER